MPSKKTTKIEKPESQRQADWGTPNPPDPHWARAITSLEVTRDTLPDDFCNRPTFPSSRVVEAPPKAHAPVAAVHGVVTGLDEGLAKEVGERLAESKAFDDHHLELRVNHGEVELGGVVASQADKFEAEHLASSVRGVICVVNHLRVGAQEVEGS